MRRRSAPAIYLCPSGYTRLDIMACRIKLDCLAILSIVRQCMRTRTNKRHVATQDVKQLRELVEAEFPQHPANTGNAVVTTTRLPNNRSIIECRHRSKLEDIEWPTVQTNPALPEQYRPR